MSGWHRNRFCERHFHALADANYNVLGMVNAAGNLVERYSYSPYGQRSVFSHGWSVHDVNGDGAMDSADLALGGGQRGHQGRQRFGLALTQ